MSDEREELADIIQDAGEYIPGSHGEDYVNPYKAADAILAAGYAKPRQITTVKELDALPDYSAILDGEGDVAQKLSGWWHFPETAPMGSSKVLKYGAVTVLYTPEPLP